MTDKLCRALSVAMIFYFFISLSEAAAQNENNTFYTLPEIKSVHGVLETTLVAKKGHAYFGEYGLVTTHAKMYNGEFAGPVLRVRPGDTMRITLINKLSEATNLHFHGIHTTPQGHGDNVHVIVNPGETFTYIVPISPHQPAGLYWYHAHLHGLANEQVNDGLSGALLVEGFVGQFPDLSGITEKIMVLKDFALEDSTDPYVKEELQGLVRTMNGKVFSTMTMRPGETQLWHISNQSTSLYYHLSLVGHSFRIIGDEGVSTNKEGRVDMIDLKPAERVEVLVDAGNPGIYDLISEKTPTGSGKDCTLKRPLGQIIVEGEDAKPIATIAHFPEKQDLSTLPVNAYRTITFSQDVAADKYFIDKKTYDENRMDIRVPLGNIEEWTIRNDSDDFHVFHIHQLHFQVTEINGKKVPFDGYADDVTVAERSVVKVRIPFTNPEMVGRFVYHCHILEHEDKGMMANIEVYDPNQSGLKRLWNAMGYCCSGRFSLSCMWANVRLMLGSAAG